MLKLISFCILLPFFGYTQVTNDYCELVVHRPFFPFGIGSLSALKIKNGNKLVLKIHQNKQMSIFLPAGEVFLNSSIIRKGKLNFVMQKGNIYFVTVKIGGLFLDKPKLEITKISQRIN